MCLVLRTSDMSDTVRVQRLSSLAKEVEVYAFQKGG